MSTLELFDDLEKPHVLLTWEDYPVKQTQNFLIPMQELNNDDMMLLKACHDKYLGGESEDMSQPLHKLHSYVRVEKTGRFFRFHVDMTQPICNDKGYTIRYIFISGVLKKT